MLNVSSKRHSAFAISLLWFVYCLAACRSSQAESNLLKQTVTSSITPTPAPLLAASESPSLQSLSEVTHTPTPYPTSTPWPTIDPTLYATLYVTPTFTFTPTPDYYSQIKGMYRQLIGEWWGKMGVSVNRQGRKVQYSVVVFYPQCEIGQICGRYHFDNGCFGELVLDNWRPTFLVFRNLEYSGKSACPNWRPMNVRPLLQDRLSFSFGYRNEAGNAVSKSVVLRRK
jgi:hypothetical protein